MPTQAFELTRLDPKTFEHLVNNLALKVLGMGVTGFSTGPDGGRDGYFDGEAEYPSTAERWKGVWYIQSKFRESSTAGNPQQWLKKQVQKEIAEFNKPDSKRVKPDNWIIATNIDPSGVPDVGAFDQIRQIIAEFDPDLALRTHVWGGTKIIGFLSLYPNIANHYAGLLTSGHVISSILASMKDASASVERIINQLVVTSLSEQQYTKLEQAGSSTDTRPGIQTLFTDLPFAFDGRRESGILDVLCSAMAENHRPVFEEAPLGKEWEQWRRQPERSRIWFIRGGPGNGKSTVTQFACQIQRAALICMGVNAPISSKAHELATDIENVARKSGFWPIAPRVPLQIELRLYAHWYGQQDVNSPRGVLSYIAHRLRRELEQDVVTGSLLRAFGEGRWLFVFDGLDEVPGDVKDELAREICQFVDGSLMEFKSDAIVVCTSRPQGYSGQFDEINPTIIDLVKLSPEEALQCADPVLRIDRNAEDVNSYRSILKEAITSPSIQEIMTTPLQSHIMAVVVRDGGRPPERKWQLFSNFYQVIKKREANRSLIDPKISRLLREGDKLIKSLHNRLGFELHYLAEKSTGAETSIERPRFNKIIQEVVVSLVRRQNIWLRLQLRLAESRPLLLVDVKRRAFGAASGDVGWSGV